MDNSFLKESFIYNSNGNYAKFDAHCGTDSNYGINPMTNAASEMASFTVQLADLSGYKYAFLPNKSLYNMHPTVLESFLGLCIVHKSAVEMIGNLIAGQGIVFTDLNGNELTTGNAKSKLATEYLRNIGYTKIHGAVCMELYLYGASALNFIELFDRDKNRFGIVKVQKKKYSEFRLSVPKYDRQLYDYVYPYHFYTNEMSWVKRGRSYVSAVNVIIDQQVTHIRDYDPDKTYAATPIIAMPVWSADMRKRDDNAIHSYLLTYKDSDTYYPTPPYETKEFFEHTETLYEMARHIKGVAKNGFTAEHIINIYREIYRANPESHDFQEQIKYDADAIKQNLVKEGNAIINALPIGSIDGETYEGKMEIQTIPKAPNTAKDKLTTIETSTDMVLAAHRIPGALIGLRQNGNSLANQKEYLAMCLNILNLNLVAPIQRRIQDELLNGILLTEQNGFGDIKAKIVPINDERILANTNTTNNNTITKK
jgi:hypothetical protein